MSQLKGAEIGEGLCTFFEELFDAARDQTGKLSAWEQDFITDVSARFEEARERFRCSEKQWSIFTRIGNKLGVQP